MANINIRIDDELKEESKEILDSLGVDLTSGIKIFLKQVVLSNGIPFELTLNKPDIIYALEDIQSGRIESFDSVSDLMKELNEITSC